MTVCVGTTREVMAIVKQACKSKLFAIQKTRETVTIKAQSGEHVYTALLKNSTDDFWIIRYNPKHFAVKEE